MTDIIVKIIEDDPSQYAEGISSQEQILKDCGMSLPEIKAYMAENLPPPPTPPEEVERRRQMQEQLEALEKAEAERERLEKLKQSDPEAYEREMNPKAGLLIIRFSFCLTFVKEQTLLLPNSIGCIINRAPNSIISNLLRDCFTVRC